jgi:hypothetical protein
MVTVTELQDAKLNQDREVFLNDQNDIATTSGDETVEQSVAIAVGNEIRGLIGGPITGTTLQQIQQRISEAIANDPQAVDPLRVEVTEVNKQDNSVAVRVITAQADYQLTVDV